MDLGEHFLQPCMQVDGPDSSLRRCVAESSCAQEFSMQGVAENSNSMDCQNVAEDAEGLLPKVQVTLEIGVCELTYQIYGDCTDEPIVSMVPLMKEGLMRCVCRHASY